MKSQILYFFIIIGGMLISCQEEEREFIDPNEDNTIPRNSQLASLMKNVVTHDGSFDDVVDKGNCFSINLPYTIVLNDKEFEIKQILDYQEITDTDQIEIKFPITITTSNHIEEKVQSDDELKTFIDSCTTNDDDIECIDFVYPILLSTFNSNSNQLNTIEVVHDSQLFTLMNATDAEVSMSIQYPIDLRLHDGSDTDVNHNTDLMNKILEVASSCDEND